MNFSKFAVELINIFRNASIGMAAILKLDILIL